MSLFVTLMIFLVTDPVVLGMERSYLCDNLLMRYRPSWDNFLLGLAAAFKPPADPSGNGSDSPGLNLRTSLLNRFVMVVLAMLIMLAIFVVTSRYPPVHQGRGRRHPREANEKEAKALRRMFGMPEERQLRRLRSVQEREESPDLQEPTLRSADREKGRRFFLFLTKISRFFRLRRRDFPFSFLTFADAGSTISFRVS